MGTLEITGRFMNSLLTAVSDLFPRRKSGPKIVAILAAEEDRSLVSELCAASDWDVSFAGTRQEAHAALDRAKAQILLLDRNVAGDDWREAMSSFAASSDRACIMLVSRIVDTYLWNDVVRNGGYEVLAKTPAGRPRFKGDQTGLVLLEHCPVTNAA